MDETGAEKSALAAAGGDSEALRQLYDHFSPRLFGYLADMTNSALAEDLLHELWLKVMHNLGKRRGPIRPWLFVVARNLAIDAMRAARPTASLDGRIDTADAAGDGPSDTEEESRQLRSAVQRLPALCRDVVLLRHYSALPLKSIAGILEIPIGTVASRLRTALCKLQKEVYCDSRHNI